jgi:hypothetical protein
MNDTIPADLASLDRLVGTWHMTGDARGTVRYEWADGNRFLFQHVDIVHDDHHIQALEVIGHLNTLDGQTSADVHSRVYSYLDGLTLDYVYELAGDMLTIWGGERSSPAYFTGTFDPNDTTMTGSWVWPDGQGGTDGYSTTITRAKQTER